MNSLSAVAVVKKTVFCLKTIGVGTAIVNVSLVENVFDWEDRFLKCRRVCLERGGRSVRSVFERFGRVNFVHVKLCIVLFLLTWLRDWN